MKTMVISIRNTAGVRCREVVRFSEGPLWEVRLYTYHRNLVNNYPIIHVIILNQVNNFFTSDNCKGNLTVFDPYQSVGRSSM